MADTASLKLQASPRRGPKRRLQFAVMLLLGVSVAALLAWSGVVRPAERFGTDETEGRNVFGFSSVAVGETVLVTMLHVEKPLKLAEATPVLAGRSARVEVDLVACRRRDDAPLPGAVVGEPLSNYCQSDHPVTETALGPDADGEVVLLVVAKPLEPGRVFIDGVQVTHSRGPFHRTEHTGVAVDILAR